MEGELLQATEHNTKRVTVIPKNVYFSLGWNYSDVFPASGLHKKWRIQRSLRFKNKRERRRTMTRRIVLTLVVVVDCVFRHCVRVLGGHSWLDGYN